MNDIVKKPIGTLGYDFIDPQYLRANEDEYYLREQQNPSDGLYRALSANEIIELENNNNTSDNWSRLLVKEGFNASHIKNCKFYGLVRIGRLDSIAHRYHNVTLPIGIYDSTIISSDFGDNVVVSNVRYMSHYIVGNDVVLLNIDELHVTDHAKFGNGIVKEGENESVRIWIEVRNENAGRKILAFDGMLPGDAWLWSKHRDDKKLLERFKEFTEDKFDKRRGRYGQIGDRSVVKNTSIIKDVLIGSDAYIKGANKLKNLTIRSAPKKSSQIGEGCELVNGIIGYGCRVFYGVKAVRFIMASHSQLKYGARLINSFLSNNSTISCCEVLNSLIFPGHEQHHNNSFLCAAVVMGQSNIAAGATIGSNHNSRAADGEILAARGFWPGLCVSLKHNSKFAAFTLLAKGDYQYELNVQLPFSLVSNDLSKDSLSIMPGYWFEYNMYALARNSDKLRKRDLRSERIQRIEYDFLAPDTINEIFEGLKFIEDCVVDAFEQDHAHYYADSNQAATVYLKGNFQGQESIRVLASGIENSSRDVVIIKAPQAFRIYNDLIVYYGLCALINVMLKNESNSFDKIITTLPSGYRREHWTNVGGQLIQTSVLDEWRGEVRDGKVQSWEEVHNFYRNQGEDYEKQQLQHAVASLEEHFQCTVQELLQGDFAKLMDLCLETKAWMLDSIIKSRAKDYQSKFRKMLYDNDDEMNEVLGNFEDNSFIAQEQESFDTLQANIERLKIRFGLK